MSRAYFTLVLLFLGFLGLLLFPGNTKAQIFNACGPYGIEQPSPGYLHFLLYGVTCPKLTYYVDIITQGSGGNPGETLFTVQLSEAVNDSLNQLIGVDLGSFQLFRPGEYIAEFYHISGKERVVIAQEQFSIPESAAHVKPPPSDIYVPEKNPLICQSPDGNLGIQTPFGCFTVVPGNSQVANFIRLGVGIAGGVALLMMTISGFMVMTSQADPKRLEAAKSLLFSAIAGLILITLSVFIIRILGGTILGLF